MSLPHDHLCCYLWLGIGEVERAENMLEAWPGVALCDMVDVHG